MARRGIAGPREARFTTSLRNGNPGVITVEGSANGETWTAELFDEIRSASASKIGRLTLRMDRPDTAPRSWLWGLLPRPAPGDFRITELALFDADDAPVTVEDHPAARNGLATAALWTVLNEGGVPFDAAVIFDVPKSSNGVPARQWAKSVGLRQQPETIVSGWPHTHDRFLASVWEIDQAIQDTRPNILNARSLER